ncbi:TolB family protein [Actinomadura welshii]
MTDDLDRALRGALTTAARQAPAADPGLLERVEAGHRRRRRRRASAAALAVAVVVGGTGAAGGLLRSGEDAPPVASPGELEPVSRADLGAPVKVRERWPDAVRTVPGELPNGRELHPVTLLDDGTLVGRTWSSLEKADKLWAYDLDARKATVITDIVVPRGSKIFASDFTVGGGQIVWWLSYRVDGRDTVEIWGAPVAGGTARKLTGLPGDNVSTLLIDGDAIVWGMADGVYRVPLAGGTPERIPGTDGFGIVSWPWIGSPASDGKKVGDIKYKSLWNVRTGERRGARLAPYKGMWSCGVTWCVGGPAPGITYHGKPAIAVQRRDGEAGSLITSNGLIGPMWGAIHGRFLVYHPRRSAVGNHVLYDVETGTLLDTGARQYNGERMGPALNDRDPQHFVSGEDGLVLIDFSKIG